MNETCFLCVWNTPLAGLTFLAIWGVAWLMLSVLTIAFDKKEAPIPVAIVVGASFASTFVMTAALALIAGIILSILDGQYIPAGIVLFFVTFVILASVATKIRDRR